MSHQAFRYDFSFKELIYFLFGKKICPKCGKTLMKIKDYETVSGAQFNRKTDPFFVPNANVKHYIYKYQCSACHSEYTLKELSDM